MLASGISVSASRSLFALGDGPGAPTFADLTPPTDSLQKSTMGNLTHRKQALLQQEAVMIR